MAFKPQPFGKYYLLEKIASGGMAVIYKAKTFGVVGFEKLLAIKRILPHLSQDEDFVKMLVDEAKIAVQLNHMNIVQVYDLGKIEDDYFIAMEYIDGKDLRTIMRRCEDLKQRVSVENAVFIVVEICKGLDYAHRKKDQFGLPSGIVHRDISPQNILISFEGEVKIVDFGIAKAKAKSSETDAGVLKGKFAYMSPEQARGQEVDQKTDIFSTGILLYELLTGERLFYAENNIQSLEKIKNFDIEPPFLPPDIPSELEYILMQALQNDPKYRYQTANAFQVDLTKFLYSSALDFTSKNLADLMERCFPVDIEQKDEKRDQEGEIEIDTQTRLMIAEANQQVLVTRENEGTPSGIASKLVSKIKGKPKKGKVPTPAELFESSQRWKGARYTITVIVLFIVMSAFWYFRHDVIEGFKKIPQSIAAVFHGERNAPEEVIRPVIDDNLASIYVETDPPGAKIYLDNVELDSLTPHLVKKVTPSESHLLLVSLQNYKQYQKKLNLEPGEIFQIQAKLVREVGNVFVTSQPSGADVYINDVLYGKTPKQIDQLNANVDIAVKIRKENHKDYFEVVRIQPDKQKILRVNLSKIQGDFGSVRITSIPPGAKIFLDGTPLREKTPVLINELDIEKVHYLVLQLKGFEEHSQSFRVTQSQTKLLKVYLKTQPEQIP